MRGAFGLGGRRAQQDGPRAGGRGDETARERLDEAREQDEDEKSEKDEARADGGAGVARLGLPTSRDWLG